MNTLWNRGRLREAGLVLLVFFGLTVLFTWPLSIQGRDSVADSAGDNLHFAWMIGWFQEAVFERGVNPYFVPDLNYPEGWELARSEIPLTMVLAALPVSLIADPITAYNFAVFLSFLLTGVFTYCWLRHLDVGVLPSLFAGVAFAFSPFRIAHFRAGHLNILTTMWFPLFFMGLIDVLRGRRISLRLGIVSGLSFGLISLSSQYYFYLTCLIAFILIVVSGVLTWWKERRFFELGRGELAAIMLSIPLSIVGVIPYLLLSSQGELPKRSVFTVSGGSASLTDFVLPSTDHFLWGEWVSSHFSRNSWIEGSLYVGLALTILAVLGFFSRVRAGGRERALAILLLGMAILAGTIALGTHLYWNEQPVEVSLPAPLASALGRSLVSVRMPGYYLFDLVPFYDRMRTFKRSAALVLLPISMLAGLGLDSMLQGLGRRRTLLASLGVFFLLFLEIYPGPVDEWEPVVPRPVDRWLREQQGTGAVLIFPFELQEDQRQVYANLHHHKPLIGGFFSAFPPRQFRRLELQLSGFPEQFEQSALTSLPIEYILVDLASYPDPSLPLASLNLAGWHVAARAGDYAVFTRSVEEVAQDPQVNEVMYFAGR